MVNEKDNNTEKVVDQLNSIPVWMLEEDSAQNLRDVILAAARKAFIYKRYQEVLKQEDQFWGQVALEKLQEGEVPRWVDSRRHISQYHGFGKESWMELYRILFHKQLKKLLIKVKDLPGPVLELGCGCGWLALELARLGKDVVGLDASEISLTVARFFYKHCNFDIDDFKEKKLCGLTMLPSDKQGKIQYEFQDLNSLNLPEKKYSAVVVWESLHHIHNLEGLVEQVRYTLRPGGFFIVHETINEHLSGRGLQRLLTKSGSIKLLSSLHTRSGRPESKQTQTTIFTIFKKVFQKKEKDETPLCSPFEGVSGHEMIKLFKKHFEIEHGSFHHHFLTEAGGFNTIMNWTVHLGFAPKKSLVRSLFGFLKKIDDWLIRLKLVTPRHGFFILKPKNEKFIPGPFTLKTLVEKRKVGPKEWNFLIKECFNKIKQKMPENLDEEKVIDTYSMLEVFKGRLAPAEELSSLMLISGWHLEEGKHRWMNGRAELFFCFPEGSKKLDMEILGSPLVSENNPQKVAISAEGKILTVFNVTIPGWQKYTMNLPEKLPKGVFKLSLKSDSFIPKELNLSEDSRTLGIAIKYIAARQG